MVEVAVSILGELLQGLNNPNLSPSKHRNLSVLKNDAIGWVEHINWNFPLPLPLPPPIDPPLDPPFTCWWFSEATTVE